MSTHSLTSAHRQRGLSLIELMIAILLSTFLLLGLVQVFAASRTAYQLSQGVARAQENGRFAMDFLMRDLRMAGHTGCVNDQALTIKDGGGIVSHLGTASLPLRFDVSIQGFEAIGTSPTDTVTLSADPATGAASDWNPELPAEFSGLDNPPVADSDIVMLRFLSPVGTTLSSFAGGDPATIIPSVGGEDVVTQFATSRSLFGLANCQRASIFQATTLDASTGKIEVSDSGLNQTALGGVELYSGGQAVLYPAESVAYYVGVNDGGNPALYRIRWSAAPGGALGRQVEELVEGVESLQLLYGQDEHTAVDELPTGYISEMKHAGEIGGIGDDTHVTFWRRVGAVQVGLLTRSIEPSGISDSPTQYVLGTTFAPPDDARFRSSYETTIALRNRMFGN